MSVFSAISAGSSAAQRRPVLPSSTMSTTPPTLVATTGTPDACASMITLPNASGVVVADTRQSRPRMTPGTSCLAPVNSTAFDRPSRRTRISRSFLYFSFGASPTITAFISGIRRRSSDTALIKSACPLSGVIRETIPTTNAA